MCGTRHLMLQEKFIVNVDQSSIRRRIPHEVYR
jgi:hypothetical protein